MSLAAIDTPAFDESQRSAARFGSPSLIIDQRRGAAYLVLPAAQASAEAMSMMVRFGSGFVYVALPDWQADRLELPAMVRGGRRLLGGVPTVTVDAARGISTGISAADRACTTRTLANPASGPDDLIRPGHIVPIRISRLRPFARSSPVRAALALARRLELPPAVAITEVVSELDPRRMADGTEARRFALRLGFDEVSARVPWHFRRPDQRK